ncbi:MAG TPA: hypothetical protein VGC88_05535 [Terriglobales bacterium]
MGPITIHEQRVCIRGWFSFIFHREDAAIGCFRLLGTQGLLGMALAGIDMPL